MRRLAALRELTHELAVQQLAWRARLHHLQQQLRRRARLLDAPGQLVRRWQAALPVRAPVVVLGRLAAAAAAAAVMIRCSVLGVEGALTFVLAFGLRLSREGRGGLYLQLHNAATRVRQRKRCAHM